MRTLSEEIFGEWQEKGHNWKMSEEEFKKILIAKIDEIVCNANYEEKWIRGELDNRKKIRHGSDM